MSEPERVDDVLVVFNCITCGAMLTVNNHSRVATQCENCGAGYDLNGDPNLVRYYKGRVPTQWRNNGWDGETQKAEGVH